MNKLGIYVHIPFCKRKCDYCDFISFSCNEDNINLYFDSLIKEVKNRDINNLEKNRKVSTIYIGGGTPSYPNSGYIVNLLEAIKSRFLIEEETEITIEVNPGTVNKQKLIDYKNAGINRISIGLQAVQDRLLKLIGRIHNYDEFLNTYNLAKEVGFSNINVDLMLALPTQTENELVESLNSIINLNPNHISLYSLIIEEGTLLKKNINSGKLELLDEKMERIMYWKSKQILEENGYIQYEISNFSKKGFESKHNLDCWNQEEYIGFGLAAHSYLNNKRLSNISDMHKYLQNVCENNYEKNIQVNEIQDEESKLKEYMMLGFRKIDGVRISEFEKRFRINPLIYFRFEIDRLAKKELIEVDLDNIKLTPKGLDFANIVFEEFV